MNNYCSFIIFNNLDRLIHRHPGFISLINFQNVPENWKTAYKFWRKLTISGDIPVTLVVSFFTDTTTTDRNL